MMINQGFSVSLFLRFNEQCISKKIVQRFLCLNSVLSGEFSFSYSLNCFSSWKIRPCFGVGSSDLPRFSFVGYQNLLPCCYGLLVRSSWFRFTFGIMLRNTLSTGFMNLVCFGVTTEDWAVCVCLLIFWVISLLPVNLISTFLLNKVGIEYDASKLAVLERLSVGVIIPVGFHYDGQSPKAVMVFVVIGGAVRVSSVRAVWGLALFLLAALLNCFFKWGEWMTPCVMSLNTQLCLIRCKQEIGLVKFFNTTKCFAKVKWPISNSSAAVANGFLTSSFLVVFENLEDCRIWTNWWDLLFISVPVSLVDGLDISWWVD